MGDVEEETQEDFSVDVLKAAVGAIQEWVGESRVGSEQQYKLAVHDVADDDSWVDICVRQGWHDITVYRIDLKIHEK